MGICSSEMSCSNSATADGREPDLEGLGGLADRDHGRRKRTAEALDFLSEPMELGLERQQLDLQRSGDGVFNGRQVSAFHDHRIITIRGGKRSGATRTLRAIRT